MCPFLQAGLTGRCRTSRRPRAQNFENESSFQFLSVSGPIKLKLEFDAFSREVTVTFRTITSSHLEPTLQPLRHPPSHFRCPHSTLSPFGHAPVRPWQANFGSSTSSQAMNLMSNLFS